MGPVIISEEVVADLLKYGLDKKADEWEADKSEASTMLRHMRNEDYGSAVKVATKHGLTAETTFENVVVFETKGRRRFSKINGGVACLAAATNSAGTIQEIQERIDNAFNEVFSKGNFGTGEVFKATCPEAAKFHDCVMFIVTKDGVAEPMYTEDNERSLIALFNLVKRLSNDEYSMKDHNSMEFLLKGGFNDTISFLARNMMLGSNKGMVRAFRNLPGVDQSSVSEIEFSSQHKFRLHEPEVVFDGEYDRPTEASAFAEPMERIGYDICGGGGQMVGLKNAISIVNTLFSTYLKYKNTETITDNPFEEYLGRAESMARNFVYSARMYRDSRNKYNYKMLAREEQDQVEDIKRELAPSISALLRSLRLPSIEIDYGQTMKDFVKGMEQFSRSMFSDRHYDMDYEPYSRTDPRMDGVSQKNRRQTPSNTRKALKTVPKTAQKTPMGNGTNGVGIQPRKGANPRPPKGNTPPNVPKPPKTA